MKDFLLRLLKREPVALIGAFKAFLMCAVLFGAKLTPEQQVALVVLVEAVLTPITRALVTPA